MILYGWWLSRGRGDELIEEPELVSVSFLGVCCSISFVSIFEDFIFIFNFCFIVTPIEIFNLYLYTGIVLSIEIIFIWYCCLRRVVITSYLYFKGSFIGVINCMCDGCKGTHILWRQLNCKIYRRIHFPYSSW